ncbi:unnamed protein product [Ilex paraguariensis]|uniref:Uncharacterized protein n=1 Tax=Ilex paraguariensis TaxID=185542 RepID=A0ABC8T7G9_9AQUA
MDADDVEAFKIFKREAQSVKFNYITNASIQSITSVDSKFFHFAICESENIIVSNVKISAPGDSPNTDGIHVSNSKNIKILNSSIATGDDCVSLGPGNTNVSISGISCGPGHGISIGSLGKYPNEKTVKGIFVRNCTFSNTQNGVRIKTWAPSPPSKVTGVTFQDIVMYNIDNPIIIDQQYCPSKPCSAKGDSLVQISDVNYINIQGSSSSKVAVNVQCSPSFPCQGIKFNGINISYSGQGGPATASCSNVKASFQGQQIPPPCV